MAFCGNCGTHAEEGTKFCPSCGTEVQSTESSKTASVNSKEDKVIDAFDSFNDTKDNTADFEKHDIEQNKIMAVLSYFSWLVMIPIFAAKDSKYARFHANQGLTLAIGEIIWGIVDGVISMVLYTIFASKMWGIYRLLTNILDLGYWIWVVIAVIGILNAFNGKAKELPVIGKVKILK